MSIMISEARKEIRRLESMKRIIDEFQEDEPLGCLKCQKRREKEVLAGDKQERKRYDMETKTLAGILDAYYQSRNEGAYSRKAKTNNLKQQAEILCFLTESQISTFPELEEKVKEMYHEVSEVSSAVRSNEKEAKEIRDKLSIIQNYRTYKPVYDNLCQIKGCL